ncbi:MAG: hypothetical protein II849_00685 [Bacteroidales bacterium]|jgi:hypothetical protein|nr:hypothetical protein [Bacteroidales bacterium]
MEKDSLNQVGSAPFQSSVLLSLFSGTKRINDKARRLEQEKRIIRLKKGLYVRSADDGATLSLPLIANHLYGPSYVSMHTALRHYGLIPERVYEIQSLTIKHSRNFDTPLGLFSYHQCDVGYFSAGMRQEQQDGYMYLIASPEKALCDLLLKTPRLNIQSLKGFKEYLEDDLRLEVSALVDFDTNILEECRMLAKTKSKMIDQLITLIANERCV